MSLEILPASIPSIAAGGIALALGSISLFSSLRAQELDTSALVQFQAAQQQRVQMETSKMEADKAISEAAQKNRVVIPKQLVLLNYVKNPSRPQLDWDKVVNPADCVEIYDRFRKRVGTAFGGEYYPFENAKNLCNEVAND